jgi:hypothetical protein
MGPRIVIEYDMFAPRMRFPADPTDFRGMAAKEIEAEIRDLIDQDAKANFSFYPTNIVQAVREIQEALEAERREDEEAV